MKNFVKKILSNFPKAYYISYCIQNIKNENFREKVLGIKTNPYCLIFEHNGQINKGKLIYKIMVGDETKGFCSALRDLLYFLIYSDSVGMIPYIQYTNNTPFSERGVVNDTLNPFEYYFLQPSGMSLDDVKLSCASVNNEYIHIEGAFELWDIEPQEGYYQMQDEQIELCSRIYGKYIHLNNDVEEKLKADINQIICDRTIGVHYRGTDFKIGYNGHPSVVEAKNHISEVEKLFSSGGYDKVFLATEDGDVIDEFRRAFGENLLIYNDVVRGSGSTNAYNIEVERENHKYLLGYEVLRDVYTLAACDAFISSLSGVGFMGQIVKLSSGKQFNHVKIFCGEINNNSKILQKNKY